MTNFTYTPTGTGAVTRDAANKLCELVSVLDYIPETEHAAIFARTSSYDCTNAFRNAAALRRGVFVPRGEYKISGTLNLVACPVLVGDGFSEDVTIASKILWTGGLLPMFEVKNTQTEVRDLLLDGNGLADCAIQVLGGASSVLDRLTIKHTKRDGIRFSTTPNNNSVIVSNSTMRDLGTLNDEGSTIDPQDPQDDGVVTAGTRIFNVYGAGNLTTLGIRPGLDLVRIGSSPLHTIESVGPGSLEISQGFAANYSGTVEIRIGHGVAIERQSDNNVIAIVKNVFLQCKGSGLRDNAFYGAHARDNLYEQNGYGRIIGRLRPDIYEVSLNYGALELGGYFEGNFGGADIMLESTRFTRVEPALLWEEATGAAQAERIYVLNFSQLYNPVFEFGGIRTEGRTLLMLNQTTVDVDFDNTFYRFLHSAAAGNGVINLPPMTSAKRRAMFSRTEAKIVLMFMDISGRSFTIKSPDTPVNGVPGATGVTVGGNWTKREIRLDNDAGWLVTG